LLWHGLLVNVHGCSQRLDEKPQIHPTDGCIGDRHDNRCPQWRIYTAGVIINLPVNVNASDNSKGNDPCCDHSNKFFQAAICLHRPNQPSSKKIKHIESTLVHNLSCTQPQHDSTTAPNIQLGG